MHIYVHINMSKMYIFTFTAWNKILKTPLVMATLLLILHIVLIKIVVKNM